jgi:phospholipid/cholesterol/gamma-HCH transport system substrate-binding protein
MADRRNRMRLGLFTAASLATLAALVVLFGRSPNLFSPRDQYTVLFPEAPGLDVGTPVRKSGVRIGQVTGVALDEASGMVRVGIELDPKYPPRKSEEAVISRGLLNGDTSLDFLPMKAEKISTVAPGVYDPHAEIVGVPPLSPRTLLKDATDALPTAQENVARVVNSITRFEQAVPKVEHAVDEIAALAHGGREFVPELRQTNIKVQDLLGQAQQPADQPVTVRAMLKEIMDLLQTIRPVADDVRQLLKTNGPELTQTLKSVRQAADSANAVLSPENQKAVTATVKNLQDGSGDLVKTIRIAALLIDQAEKTVKTVNDRIAQAEAVIASIGRAANNVERGTKPIADNSEKIVAGLSESLKNLNTASAELTKALTEVRATVASVNRGEGTVGKALTDPTLYNNLNDTTINVARVMARIDKIAQDLQVFADKVARRPETVGIGGALRPSTGLKESPTAPLPPGAQLPLAPVQLGHPTPVLPLAPGMVQPAPLMPIPPVPLNPIGPQPQTVYKPGQ